MDLSLIFDFLEDLDRHPKKGLAYSSGLLLVSLLLLFIVPSLILGAYDDTTIETIQRAEALLQKTDEKAPTQDWYVESYYRMEDRRHFQLWLNGAHDQLESEVDGARSLYEEAKFGWPANRVRRYESAQAAANQAIAATDSVVALFDHNDSLRMQAVNSQHSLTQSLSMRDVSQDLAQERFDREKNEFLTKYTNPFAQALENAQAKLSRVDEHLGASVGYLPDFNIRTKTGDPLMALEELDRAQALINEITTLQDQVTAGLDYQIEARDTARPKSGQAATSIEQAANHLNSIDSQYHWGFAGALLPASNSIADARRQLSFSLAALDTPVQNELKFDWPVAYEAAKLSLSLSQSAVSMADEQVGFYTTTMQFLDNYSQAKANVEFDISSAQSVWNVIEDNHASSTWEGMSDNVSEAKAQVSNSVTARDNTQRLIGSQQFTEAKSQAEAAVGALNGASELCYQVVSLRDNLEGYRSSWPSKKTDANDTIESNRSQVQQYGGYDYSAKKSFEEAETLFSEAQSHANAREYEIACSLADQATVSASGTGLSAKRSYDSEMQRQADETRRQQEEARRQQEQQYSSPSTSCCDSPSSNNDGGGYGGGGNNDGGGYGGDSSGSDDGGGY